jgi:hypothetical protein
MNQQLFSLVYQLHLHEAIFWGYSTNTVLTGPVNHFRAETAHDTDAKMKTAPMINTA